MAELLTAGSWYRSPKSSTVLPPNGRELWCFGPTTSLNKRSIASKSVRSIMEISSTITVSVCATSPHWVVPKMRLDLREVELEEAVNGDSPDL